MEQSGVFLPTFQCFLHSLPSDQFRMSRKGQACLPVMKCAAASQPIIVALSVEIAPFKRASVFLH